MPGSTTGSAGRATRPCTFAMPAIAFAAGSRHSGRATRICPSPPQSRTLRRGTGPRAALSTAPPGQPVGASFARHSRAVVRDCGSSPERGGCCLAGPVASSAAARDAWTCTALEIRYDCRDARSAERTDRTALGIVAGDETSRAPCSGASSDRRRRRLDPVRVCSLRSASSGEVERKAVGSTTTLGRRKPPRANPGSDAAFRLRRAAAAPRPT